MQATITMAIAAATVLSLNIACAKPPRLGVGGVRAWASVESVPTGSNVRVDLVAGSSVVGTLVSADPHGIVIQHGAASRAIGRGEVLRLFAARSRRVADHAVRGFLAGAAVGALQGLLLTESNRGEWAAMLGAGWGAVGMATAAAIETSRGSLALVFQR